MVWTKASTGQQTQTTWEADSMATEMEDLLVAAERLANLGSWSITIPGREVTWSDGLHRITGRAPGRPPAANELDLFIHPEDVAALDATVQRALADPEAFPQEGAHLEFRVVRPDGSVREVLAHGLTARARDSGAWRFFGALQDVTEQRMTERDLQAHYAVTQTLREWESFDEGVVVLLRRLGTALDTTCAGLWTLDPSGEHLVCRAFWTVPERNLLEFTAAARTRRFRRGESVIGGVWERAEPVGVPEMTATTTDLGRIASAAGMRSLIAFPAGDAAGPIAVIALVSDEPRELTASLQRTLTGIGHELGNFLERRRAQLQPSPLSARELEVLRLAAEGNSGPEIAARLIVSPSTVKTHFENIYEKLGVGDRGGAVAHALRIGLIH
jgi:PAS domain S-box-containing protein